MSGASTDVAVALLRDVAAGRAPATLRVGVPPATVAFGKSDTLRDGYDAACAAARAHGFAPVVRGPGGHATAYDDGSVVFDLVVPADSPLTGLHDLFEATSPRIAAALRDLGVDARVGAVPGEHCHGDFSVNARGVVKLCGTAQRRVRGAALLGGFVTVHGAARLRAVLTDVYAALGIDFDAASVGGVADEVPGVTTDAVAAALQAALDPAGL